jgi:uncharacterized protein (TIGR02246 family)
VSIEVPDVINSYLEADARRDTDAIVALFTDDGVVIDEGETWRGSTEIRAWREGRLPGTSTRPRCSTPSAPRRTPTSSAAASRATSPAGPPT